MSIGTKNVVLSGQGASASGKVDKSKVFNVVAVAKSSPSTSRQVESIQKKSTKKKALKQLHSAVSLKVKGGSVVKDEPAEEDLSVPTNERKGSVLRTKKGKKRIKKKSKRYLRGDLGTWYWCREQNLMTMLKISPLYPFIKSAKILFPALSIGIMGFALMLTPMWDFLNPDIKFQVSMCLNVVIGSALLFLLYWELYRRSITLKVLGYSFVVTEGIIFKTRRTVPQLIHLTIHLYQTPIDLSLNLYTFHVFHGLEDILKVENVTKKSAFKLKKYLLEQMNIMGNGASDNALKSHDEIMKAKDLVTRVKLNLKD